MDTGLRTSLFSRVKEFFTPTFPRSVKRTTECYTSELNRNHYLQRKLTWEHCKDPNPFELHWISNVSSYRGILSGSIPENFLNDDSLCAITTSSYSWETGIRMFLLVTKNGQVFTCNSDNKIENIGDVRELYNALRDTNAKLSNQLYRSHESENLSGRLKLKDLKLK